MLQCYHDFTFQTDKVEIRAFLGILFISGYISVPRWRMMWEDDTETTNSFVCNAMSRARFELLKKYSHFSDNDQLDKNDKYAKVRPLFDKLRAIYSNLIKDHIPENLCVDEAMAKYYGKHSGKQYIHNKPLKYGYKIWCLCDSKGYLIDFDSYQGKSQIDPELGLGASVVLRLLKSVPDLPYNIYCDCFFSSLKLCNRLLRQNISLTGTIMSNRTKKCPLKDQKELKKEPRGSFDYRVNTSTETIVVVFNDNKVFHVVSTAHGIEPMSAASRWSAASKKKVAIKQPRLIHEYNKYMGGVDRMDQCHITPLPFVQRSGGGRCFYLR